MGHTDSVDRVASGSAGAPAIADEIEITPEMVEAGISASDCYDFYDPDEWRLAAIYRAMTKARLRQIG